MTRRYLLSIDTHIHKASKEPLHNWYCLFIVSCLKNTIWKGVYPKEVQVITR